MPSRQTVFNATFFEPSPSDFRTADLLSTNGGAKFGLPKAHKYDGSGYDALKNSTLQTYRFLGRNAPIPDAVLSGAQTVRPYIEMEVTPGSAIDANRTLSLTFSLGTGEDAISDTVILTIVPGLRQWFTSLGGSTSAEAVIDKWRSINMNLIGNFGAVGSNLELRIHRLNFGLAIDQTPTDGQLKSSWSPVPGARAYKIIRGGAVIAETPAVSTVVPGLGGRMEIIAVDADGRRLGRARATTIRDRARDTPFTATAMTEEFYEEEE